MAQQTRNGHSASAAEVAALAGVSRQTVSRVVNGMPNVTEKTRKRVLAAMEELGFRPNFAGAALRGGSYRSIGLCMYNITRVGNLATLEGIMQAAREHDFAVTMIEMGGDKPYALADASRRMVERPVDGMILNMNRMAPDFEEFVPQPGVRTVILSMYAHPRCTTIDSDQYGSCELLTNYLLEHGHSNMRFVAGPETRFRVSQVGCAIRRVVPCRCRLMLHIIGVRTVGTPWASGLWPRCLPAGRADRRACGS
ncbi:MAG: LacI family DNA-binding transcriptional regulator [Collinsella sp.]